METFLMNIVVISVIAIIVTAASLLWRTSIYTRGAIFRPIGRLLDLWVVDGCLATATFPDKILRFIAYPLGRCIYCSSFHIGYYIFFLFNYVFELDLTAKWLLILLPLVHLFVIISMKFLIRNNPGMDVEDWMYLDRGTDKIFDWDRRASHWKPKVPNKLDTPLTKKEEEDLEACKTGTEHHKYMTVIK